jgi:hypothetical protein
MLRAHGALLAGDELAKKIRGDDTVYLPEAQFRFRRQFERPSLTEGFESVKQRSLSRDWGPEQTERALIVQLADDTMEPLRDVLQAFGAAGWTILGTAWQPGLSEEAVTSWQQSALETLGHSFRVEACVHAEGPARCWCRKPLPGLGVLLIVEERLDPARCIHIGRRPADRTWAQRLGFDYVDITDDLDALVARATSHP